MSAPVIHTGPGEPLASHPMGCCGGGKGQVGRSVVVLSVISLFSEAAEM